MFLNNILGPGGLTGSAGIKGYSGITAGMSLCILNDLAAIVAGVTSLPSVSMGTWGTGVQLDFAFDNGADTLLGTGCRTFWVYGLGPTGLPQFVLHNTNGETVSTTSEYWMRVFAASVASVGSGGAAAGNGWLAVHGSSTFVSGALTTVASGGVLKIPVSPSGTGYSGYFTVPVLVPPAARSKMAFKALTLSVAAQAARFVIRLQSNVNDGSPNWDGLPGESYIDKYLAAGSVIGFDDLVQHAEAFSPGTDIIPMIQPAVAGAVVTMGLDLA